MQRNSVKGKRPLSSKCLADARTEICKLKGFEKTLMNMISGSAGRDGEEEALKELDEAIDKIMQFEIKEKK